MTETTELTQTKGVFGGADTIVLVNGEPVPEATLLKYTEKLNVKEEPYIEGYLDIVVFNEKPPIRKILEVEKDNTPLLAVMMRNEMGDKLLMIFKDARFTKRIGGIDIDSVVFSESYHFEASDILYYEDFTYTHSESGSTLTYGTV